MLIQNLEQKIRLAFFTVVATIVGCVVLCCLCLGFATKLVREERQNIYVLDGDIPFLAQRAQLEANYLMEAQAHINLFHQYFFTLPPDDKYIEWTVGKALYMADDSALRQRHALQESGFYNDLVSSSAMCTIVCDSINVNEGDNTFTYHGTQTIRRRSRTQRRTLVTCGKLTNTRRSPNNPHGLLITGWKTLENKDLEY